MPSKTKAPSAPRKTKAKANTEFGAAAIASKNDAPVDPNAPREQKGYAGTGDYTRDTGNRSLDPAQATPEQIKDLQQ